MTTHLSHHRIDPRPYTIEYRRARGLRALRGLGLLCGLLVLGGSKAGQSMTSGSPIAAAATTVKHEESRMWMTVGESRFAITLLDNEAAHAFAALLPLTLDMAELNGNEKHSELSKALPTNASKPETIRNGDLMLYGTRTLVVFYRTFQSPYSYTRLGRVDDPTSLAQALGQRGVRIGFSANRS